MIRRLARWIYGNRYQSCPICEQVFYTKSMPLHLWGHKPMDRDVIAWRERLAADREQP